MPSEVRESKERSVKAEAIIWGWCSFFDRSSWSIGSKLRKIIRFLHSGKSFLVLFLKIWGFYLKKINVFREFFNFFSDFYSNYERNLLRSLAIVSRPLEIIVGFNEEVVRTFSRVSSTF